MSHPERKTIEISFVKKSESDLPKIKFIYFNTSTKKTKNFFVYDFIGYLKKIGFDQIHNDLGLRYAIKINNSDSNKIKKQLTLSRLTRKKICLDETRV